jgi:predicted RNA-binding protein with EMAP domain
MDSFDDKLRKQGEEKMFGDDQEKIEEALKKIDELIQFRVKYNHPENLIDLRKIKEILEK